jgi:hypothetical protein
MGQWKQEKAHTSLEHQFAICNLSCHVTLTIHSKFGNFATYGLTKNAH